MSADALRFYDVPSADGTRLRAWTNDAEGPTVLLCNGLGTSPYTWPALLRPDCGVRVLSWNHRGVGGSDRPADPRRVDVAAFVEDAVAVLDDAGVASCPVMGWSIGVNTAFELALLHPRRVTGLFAVAGVPGATFSSMGAPLQIPRFARRPIAVGIVGTLARTGWAVTPVTSRLPIGRRAANLVRHSGLMMPSAGLETVERAVAEFLTTPVEWYMHLARESARHDRVSLSQVQVPVVFVAGTFDVLASAKDMRTASRRIPGSRFVELRGSHFVQMEHPAAVHDELLAALRDLAGSTPASSDRAGSA
ncbi:MAG: alpha/beta hydrolase [Nocardioidaceae bacterium]